MRLCVEYDYELICKNLLKALDIETSSKKKSWVTLVEIIKYVGKHLNPFGMPYWYYIILFVSFFTFNSCNGKWEYDKKYFNFNSYERRIIDYYNLNDTIYFESNFGDLDTILTVEKFSDEQEGTRVFISVAPSNHLGITIRHLPVDKWYGVSNIGTVDEEISFQNLLTISKYPLSKSVRYFVEFKDFVYSGSTLGSYSNKCLIGKYEFNDCFQLDHFYPERVIDSNNLQTLYWTKELGLTAYENKSGEIWIVKR